MTEARDNERRFVAACTGRGAISPVLALYRRLVRGNVLGVVRGVLPRTVRGLGERLEAEVERFLRDRGPATHHVRDVPAELVACVASQWPPALRDLARFELTEFEISYAPRTAPDVLGDLSMTAPLALRGPLALESFAYAVQTETLPPDPHGVLFYRDDDERVRTLRLSPMAHVLLREALAGARFDHALLTAASECSTSLDEVALASTARFLDDLSERGILLGAAAS